MEKGKVCWDFYLLMKVFSIFNWYEIFYVVHIKNNSGILDVPCSGILVRFCYVGICIESVHVDLYLYENFLPGSDQTLSLTATCFGQLNYSWV
jgi:hypothetical protein